MSSRKKQSAAKKHHQTHHQNQKEDYSAQIDFFSKLLEGLKTLQEGIDNGKQHTTTADYSAGSSVANSAGNETREQTPVKEQ